MATKAMSLLIRLSKIFIPIVIVGCILAFAPLQAGLLYLSPLPKTVQEQVDEAVGFGLDGIVVYVERQGRIPEQYSAGWKNRENRVPADAKSLFKIASISKLYIAAASAKLVHRNRLKLDKTLAEYLPWLLGRIDNADQITLKMMLQHRSGIPDFIDNPQFPWAELPTDASGYLEFALDRPSAFKPGSRYGYSNTNYLLIGSILDNELGYDHRQYIKDEILDPLALTHTFGLLSGVDLREVASGYYTEYRGDLKSQNFTSPGGSMVATAMDVGLFIRALRDGSLLNSDEQLIYSSISPYEHTGLLPGYSSIARYHEDIDAVVVVFVNTSGGNSWSTLDVVYRRIIQILHREKTLPPGSSSTQKPN